MFKFDGETRRHYVLSNVNELRDEVNKEQSNFIASTEEMHLNEGFGYKLKVCLKDANDKSALKIEMFYALHNYIQDMLNYMFNKHIDVSAFMDDNELTLEFQVVSSF